MAKQYDEVFLVTSYSGFVKSELNPETGVLENRRERLDVEGCNYLMSTDADPSAKRLRQTTDRRMYSLDLTRTDDPVYAAIAQKLEEATPLILQAIALEDQRRTQEATP